MYVQAFLIIYLCRSAIVYSVSQPSWQSFSFSASSHSSIKQFLTSFKQKLNIVQKKNTIVFAMILPFRHNKNETSTSFPITFDAGYSEKNFSDNHLELNDEANSILRHYVDYKAGNDYTR